MTTPDWNREEVLLCLERVPLPLFILQDRVFRFVNHRLADLTGYSREELLGMDAWDLVYPEERETLPERFRHWRAGGDEPLQCEFRAVSRQGGVLHLRGHFSLVRWGSRPAVLGQLVDVTGEKRLVEELRAAEARLRDIFDNVNDIIYLHDPEGRFLAVNRAVERITGFLPHELQGERIPTFLHPTVKHLFGQYLKEVTEKGVARGLMRGITRDGREIFWEYQSVLFKGKQPFVRGIARDVTEQVAMRRELKQYLALLEEQNKRLSRLNEELAGAKEALERMVRTDPLTGLGNRLAFQEALEREVHRAKRYLTPLSLLIIDVDNFKAINDSLGHPAGDRALARLGKLLVANCRRSDLLFRIGGDEFAALLVSSGEEEAQAVADRLRRRITAETVLGPRVALPVALSVGAATLDSWREPLDAEELIRLADGRMYEEKRRRKA
ncbi:MAG: PAS domain S-box protein, partial [Firmicutes bacterium]|nr:PAS domain S-box protein [Bacillota bacterium]